MNIDPAQLTMTEIIRLQTQLSQELAQRFETRLALGFTDIVGSTPYFQRFGDVAGRQLQQLHLDLLAGCLQASGGRLVDSAGDGAFSCHATPQAAVGTMRALLGQVAAENEHRPREQQLALRVGLHWGRVLSDGVLVTGDAVNLCARISESAPAGEIHLSRELFQELELEQRLACRRIGPTALKGVAGEVELLRLQWRDPARFPAELVIEQTGQRFSLPAQDVVTLGRLEMIEGASANDIVLVLADEATTRRISRWHCELRRGADGYQLRAVSGQSTVVDGRSLAMGESAPVRPGSRAELSGVMTLRFESPQVDGNAGDTTSITPIKRPRP